MTLEELNEVWTLKKQLIAKEQKISALRECIETITTKYVRENKGKKSYPALDISPRSPNNESKLETITAMIIDTEAEIAKLQKRLEIAGDELTAKIKREIKKDTEQTLMLYRYVACKYFRDIGFLMEMSEARVYFVHRQILKKLFGTKVENS